MDYMPSSLRPYLKLIRIDRPIGSWLIFLPCAWAVGLATPAGTLPDVGRLALLALSSVVMRGAACTINDVFDRDFDRQVARTKTRPVASGQISVLQALIYYAFQVAVLMILLSMFDTLTMLFGVAGMILFSIYPLMKRHTDWPQAFLGMPMNWGALGGWTAVSGGACAWTVVLPLFVASFLWTIIYDTIYGHQDKKDDAKIGVRSTSLKFGSQTKHWLTFFSVPLAALLILTGYASDQSSVYYATVGFVVAHLAHQIYTVDLDNPADCMRKFCANRDLGLIFWFGIVLANLLKEKDIGGLITEKFMR